MPSSNLTQDALINKYFNAMFLGRVRFDTLQAPQAWEEKLKFSFVEHQVVEGRPVLQKMGEDLQEITLDIHLLANIEDVDSRLRQFKEMLRAGAAQSLVLANGDFLGDFVMTELVIKRKVSFADGKLWEAEATIGLKEYVPSAVLRTQALAPRPKVAAKGNPKTKSTFTRAPGDFGQIVPKPK